VPGVLLASQVPKHCEVGYRERQRQVIRSDRQPFGEISRDTRRDRTDQVGSGHHTAHSEEARLPKHNLAYQPDRSERGVNGLRKSNYGLIFVLSLSFQRLRGLTPFSAGLLFLPLTLAIAIGTRVGGAVLRNYGPFRALIWGHLAAALGALVLACFGRDFTPAVLALPLIVIGTGVGITTPAMNLAVLDSVERTQGDLASGILNSARQTGGVIGVALLGALLGEPATWAGARAAGYVAPAYSAWRAAWRSSLQRTGACRRRRPGRSSMKLTIKLLTYESV
jgi:MFS family permease